MLKKQGITEHPIIKKGDYQPIKVVTEEEIKEFKKKSGNNEELKEKDESIN